MGLKKGQTNNRDGRPRGALSKKRIEWEEMGNTLIGSWTDFIIKEGNKMIKDGNFEDFYPIYKDMVVYFKPRLSASSIKAEVKDNREKIEQIFPKIIEQD